MSVLVLWVKMMKDYNNQKVDVIRYERNLKKIEKKKEEIAGVKEKDRKMSKRCMKNKTNKTKNISKRE